MRIRLSPWYSVTLALLSWSGAYGQGRTVAITVDDLPFARGPLATLNIREAQIAAELANRKLLAAFRTNHVPVTGFVIQKTVESLGVPGGTRLNTGAEPVTVAEYVRQVVVRAITPKEVGSDVAYG